MVRPRLLIATLTLALLGGASVALAETPDAPAEATSENDSQGYAPDETGPAWTVGGYLDIGLANAGGNGTSFHPQDTRLPADYGVDTFAPAVNSRGDVASIDPDGRFTNGFLPRSVGIGGRPSAFVNNLTFDLRYEAPGAPVMVFSRVHFLPRFSAPGSESRVLVEQAFGRLAPFESHELSISVGKFDSVFGIEYLDNPSPARTGVTPSLLARYTTGTSIGAKLFYRKQIAPLWSAVSLNLAATNSGSMVEALQDPNASLTGRPVASGRLGYELNLPMLLLKLGGSGLFGPRNDQHADDVHQRGFGGDARVAFHGLSVNAEYVRIDQDAGHAADKVTGAGPQTIVSAFHVRGTYAQLAYALPWTLPVLGKITGYGRFERRHAWFGGFTPVRVERLTAGLRLDVSETIVLKAEVLLNRELEGAPSVDNDVQTISLLYLW
jgi:hypothetical protein